MNANRIFFIVFGVILSLIGLYVWFQPSWALPTRSGETMIRFGGLAKFLFGLAPFLGGLAMFRNSLMPEKRKEPLVMTLFGLGVFSMILSLLLSEKY